MNDRIEGCRVEGTIRLGDESVSKVDVLYASQACGYGVSAAESLSSFHL